MKALLLCVALTYSGSSCISPAGGVDSTLQSPTSFRSSLDASEQDVDWSVAGRPSADGIRSRGTQLQARIVAARKVVAQLEAQGPDAVDLDQLRAEVSRLRRDASSLRMQAEVGAR